MECIAMTSNIVDYCMENASKRRKYELPDESMEARNIVDRSLSSSSSSSSPSSSSPSSPSSLSGWEALQPILENEIVGAKIPSCDIALDLLANWFHIITEDKEKLRVFRQWIKSSEVDPSKSTASPSQLVPTTVLQLNDNNNKDDENVPTSSSSSFHPPSSLEINTENSKANSIDFINNEIPITPRSTPQVLLLQQLLQQQKQQIVILQKLQKPGDSTVSSSSSLPHSGDGDVPTASSITLSSSTGSAGVVLTVNIKSSQWHPFADTCACTCGFTTREGVVTTSHRVPGGSEGEMRFVVPPISFSTPDATQIDMAVHLTSCSAPHAPLVCAETFHYGRERATSAISSDDDSEDTPDSSVYDEDDEESSEHEAPSSASSSSSPKQLMTVREKMVEFMSAGKSNPARVIISQQPPSRVVWKNRRLDTPFKLRVEGVTCDTSSTKLAVLALVIDHKGKLQIDAMENFDEECNAQGIALFHNLRMTKGTWGKEWSIIFVVVTKTSMSTNTPVVVAVSVPCPVVVKTRKNPQVRHITRSESPSPIAFVESRKPDTSIRKRNRVEDILDQPSSSSSSSSSSRTSHSEAMTSLLYAAEIKQQEREYRPPSSSSSTSLPSSAPPSPPPHMILPSIQSGFGTPDPNFANLQGLLGFLEEIKIKHHPSLSIVEQPQLKRDGKVLIVKKGKPFRTPFRLQMRTAPTPVRSNFNQGADYNPQQYVCVAVLRNDKGEEVALKNSEVTFDGRGLATFSGLMVMKGTWGKSVQLTFEARWSGARRLVGGSNWPPVRMLVVCETPALQLMCYTKDKKTSAVV